MLRTEAFQNDIAQSQYKAILSTIKTEFGVDISESTPVVDPSAETRAAQNIEAIKLSRIFVNCTQSGEFANALSALASLEKLRSDGAHKWSAWAYSDLRKRLCRIAGDLDSSAWCEKKGKLRKAGNMYLDAMHAMGYHPLFNNIRETIYSRYNTVANKAGMRHESYNYGLAYYEAFPLELQALRSQIETHSLTTPFILTVNQGESLDEAVDRAIAPTDQIREKVISAVKNSSSTKVVYDKSWSKKLKKNVYSKRYVKVKADFTPGMYLISFGKNYNITWFSKANNIPLNPKAYQNQQFFKNSCMAEKSKERAL